MTCIVVDVVVGGMCGLNVPHNGERRYPTVVNIVVHHVVSDVAQNCA